MTTDALPYTASELLAVMSARLLRDGQVVFAGVGIPLLAATLAQRLHAPGLTILFEGGTIGAYVEPGQLPPSTNEQRCTRRANMVLGSTDVLLLLQRGYVDVGFMGGAQIDQYGNLNSSFIGPPHRPATRLPGTGGGNDIASLTQMIVAMKHEKRRFVERVDFVTSPGFLAGGASRRDAGLIAGGMFRVVTDLGLLGFDEAVETHDPARTASGRHRRRGAGQYRLRIAADAPISRSPSRRASKNSRCCAISTPIASTPPKAFCDDDLYQHLWPGDAQFHDLAGIARPAGADRLRRKGRGIGFRLRSGCGTTSCSASIRHFRSSTR